MTVDSWSVTLDHNANALAAVARWIVNRSGEHEKLLLVKTPFSNLETAPWRELLGAVIEHQSIGHYVELTNARKKLTGVQDIELIDPNPPSEADGFQINPKVTPSSGGEVDSLRKMLSTWGELESLAGPDYRIRFSRLSGGMRPLIVVLDDYNNYIEREGESFIPNEKSLQVHAPKYFHGDSAVRNFRECLNGYCGTLNNLSAAFDVHCPKLWPKADGYEDVMVSLNSEWLEQRREQIAAFLVDLEWRRTFLEGKLPRADELWGDMGQSAIHLLSRRFSEIPCFVFAGGYPYAELQNALSRGAHWCFTKAKSHHGYEMKEEEPLTVLALEDHLASVASVRYGAFPDLPFPNQLKVDPSVASARKLAAKLGLLFPIGRCAVGRDLQSVIARMYPDGTEVWPVRVLDTGRSNAQATFFIAAARKGQRLATRFVKVGPWIEVKREYLAYKRVIEPRLNSYVASVVGEPVVSVSPSDSAPMAGMIYSLAGFPEDFENLCSLDDMLNQTEEDQMQVKAIAQSIRRTLERVLKPLYMRTDHQQRVKLKPIARPLWCWLGDVLPPLFTGVLPPLGWEGDGTNKCRLASYIEQGYKESTAWILSARACRGLPRAGKSSPWKLAGTPVELEGFHLMEVEWGSGDQDMGRISLRHPDLGFRIKLRGRAGDIRRRFGAMWIRPGMPVDVTALLDYDNGELAKIGAAVQAGIKALKVQQESTSGSSWLEHVLGALPGHNMPDPQDVFSGEGVVPLHYTIAACQSSIHGDLNPRNILLAENGATGWLIDFERAVEQGMTAFDLAKLEVEIWHHHLLPALASISAGFLDRNKKHIGLHNAALAAVDAGMESGEVFEAHVREGVIPQVPAQMLYNAKQLLRYIDLVRDFARGTLGLAQDELWWALSAYFFVSVKFAKKHPERAALMYAASAWHLAKVCPVIPEDFRVGMDEIVRSATQPAAGQIPGKTLDGLLLAVQQDASQYTTMLTEGMATPKEGKQVEWPSVGPGERWDLASTGGVANITPIMGYLWLMVNADQSKEGAAFKVVVPKISSQGGSCGTVDILESGGLAFPEEPDAIVDACRRDGGILCRQSPDLTPVDTILMARRKKTNLMKDVELTVSSILSKKITMGCTHAIVDVKVGRDGKILAPWMGDKDIDNFVTNVSPGKMFPDVAEKYMDLLEKKLNFGSTTMTVEYADGWNWLKQEHQWSGTDGSGCVLKEVRWFFTNSAMPQCRAIGRHLILIHIDCLVNGIGTKNILFDEGKIRGTEYGTLYCKVLPALCGVKLDDNEKRDAIRAQWERLKSKLPLWGQFPAHQVFDLKNPKYKAFHGKTKNSLEGVGVAVAEDLYVISVPAYPCISGAKYGVKVKHIDAYELDKLFDWLCGETVYDTEVGIWLHTLPEEVLEDPSNTPVISVFFRPSVTPEEEVLERVRYILSECVVIEAVT